MPRAHRCLLPNHVWHLTHRCHNRQFLLAEPATRCRWVHWLGEARREYGLCVLDYMVTCSHIHLLTHCGPDRSVIERSMQLIEGRVAQEYNETHGRCGAFWSDRYHGTAVDPKTRLFDCMAYIDLNMVRAGVVANPGDWEHCGYAELQSPPARYRLIDRPQLLALADMGDEEFRACHRDAIAQRMAENVREAQWTESVAVGGEEFVDSIRAKLGYRTANTRGVEPSADEAGVYVLREERVEYVADDGVPESGRAENKAIEIELTL